MNWFLWLLLGLWLGLAIGAAFMYATHCQTINAYTLRVLRDMREDWIR